MPPPGLAITNGMSSSTALPAETPPPPVTSATSSAQIRARLSILHSQDSALESRLSAVLGSHASLSHALSRLDILRATLGTQAHSTRQISQATLSNASRSAESLSTAVRALDLEKSHVEETLHVVEQVAELKACVQGVVGSMGAPQDWEAAAGYIARASKIPTHIIEGKFASRIVPSVEVPDAPGITIENAKESLCGLFLREFQKAATDGDGVRVTRFFKLFPLIGREETGLDVYGKYVCQGVAATARANLKDGKAGNNGKDSFFYANALTKLFEHVAQIVEGHGSLVERHYGKGKMVKVIERLQLEADIQGGIILDTWSEEKLMDRKLTDVRSYPFSFLVQSFLPAQKPSSISTLARGTSPARKSGPAGRNSEDEGVDMKDIDSLLNEMAIMLARWSLYTRFVAGKCKQNVQPAVLQQAISKIYHDDADSAQPLVLPDLLIKSALSDKVSNRLTSPLNIMTTFFFRRSVEKAFQLDEYPTGLNLSVSKPLSGTAPFIISAVDDVMYIVNAVIQRSISTSQRDVVASVIPTINRVLSSDFIGMIQRKMRDESYPKPIVSGGFPSEDKIIAFLVLINSLDVSNDYITRIISSLLGLSGAPGPSIPASITPPQTMRDAFPFSHDAKLTADALQNLHASFTTKTTELLSDGLHVVFNQVVKPRLRPVLSDTFRDVDYTLSSEEISDLAHQCYPDADEPMLLFQELVTRRFESGWEGLIKSLGRIMTTGTFDSLLDQTAKYLAKVLERRLWSLSGARGHSHSTSHESSLDAFAAQRLERDFSGIIGIVSKGGRYALRRAFERIEHICIIANLEIEEWEDVVEEEKFAAVGESRDDDNVSMKWALRPEEKRKARALVTPLRGI